MMTDIMESKFKMKHCAAEARYYLDVRKRIVTTAEWVQHGARAPGAGERFEVRSGSRWLVEALCEKEVSEWVIQSIKILNALHGRRAHWQRAQRAAASYVWIHLRYPVRSSMHVFLHKFVQHFIL